jgi:hypothetical protein
MNTPANSIPAEPKMYHITHADNLPRILEAGVLWSDAKRLELGIACEIVGMSSIKQRRIQELSVSCHPGTKVGHYVPFYFCPRSVMLYILHMGNHPDITYRGGQRPMVHLQIDVAQAVAWADKAGVRWAFSDCNAGARYAVFYNDLGDLDRINWQAVHAHDFRNPQIKDGKQAEFLIHESVPFSLIEKIGVHNEVTLQQINDMLGEACRNLAVSVERSWYF